MSLAGKPEIERASHIMVIYEADLGHQFQLKTECCDILYCMRSVAKNTVGILGVVYSNHTEVYYCPVNTQT